MVASLPAPSRASRVWPRHLPGRRMAGLRAAFGDWRTLEVPFTVPRLGFEPGEDHMRRGARECIVALYKLCSACVACWLVPLSVPTWYTPARRTNPPRLSGVSPFTLSTI